MVVAEQMQLRLYVNDSGIQKVIAVMIARLSFILSAIEYSVWWLVSNKYIRVIRYVLDVLLVSAVHGIFHEHRHAIELYAANNDTGVAEVMYILWQSASTLSAPYMHISWLPATNTL